MFRKFVRLILTLCYRVKLVGSEHLDQIEGRALIVANHASFLDPILLWAYLPDDVTFAINTHIAKKFWAKPALRFCRVLPVDTGNPMSVKTLTHYLKENQRVVLFPEGRITVTGALMKIYDGAGLIADKSDSPLLPVRIDGAQYTPFSRLRGIVRLRWFPTITLNILPPVRLEVPPEVTGDQRRMKLGAMLEELMTDMVFSTNDHRRTLFQAVLDARKIHGNRRVIMEDMQRMPVTYGALVTRILALGEKLGKMTAEKEAVGLLLPSTITTVSVLLGLSSLGRIPAMLNYTAGSTNLLSACAAAEIKTVITAKRFIEMAKLENDLAQLATQVKIVFLEDVAASITFIDKAMALLGSLGLYKRHDHSVDVNGPAVILFTSGSEGRPKGVVLSHVNLLSNCHQLSSKIDFNAHDRLLNVLPLFHSFGLTAGTLTPLFSGMYCFLYPSPLHYRVIPEVSYDINATILFATNTFLVGYAKHAHAYDFYSVRLVFAGAEKLMPETRRLWSEKFGIRILEGYGVTETSPALAANTAMHCRTGSVGRLLPGIRHQLERVEGIAEGGKLHVSGPNVMLGYFLSTEPGKLKPPSSVFGPGWHDTGDLVTIDEEGYVFIRGRVKRFAKIGGEMVSLTAVEEMAAKLWPDNLHMAASLPDPQKGERILLITDRPKAERAELIEHARKEGYSEIHLPRAIHVVDQMPLLVTGKIDMQAALTWLKQKEAA
jgi:acyl-[acyl-carrier-protein]-phospholipid O-acyltransferase/long-chain-fatty-acid--[acyl-carrier-protein] ligase